MSRFDVCNGDADGLCAVLQWRLHEPAPATLVTGLKRDIALLERVPAARGDAVLVCDVSMQRNRAALLRLLDAGVRVRYFDHHVAGAVPSHALLEAHLDGASDTCTSLLMDRQLAGRFRAWALVGAYGDELTGIADTLATAAGFDADQRAGLRRLGQAINYNAYGRDVGDVCIAPAALYGRMAQHIDPLVMLADDPVVEAIDAQRRTDLDRAFQCVRSHQDERPCVVVLPDAPWGRRVSGCLANVLAEARPAQAQAVLTELAQGGFAVSVRAPRTAPRGADVFCAAFGGSGRAAAAGIDALPAQDLDRFIAAFSAARWDGAAEAPAARTARPR
jgi:hypothetical protein